MRQKDKKGEKFEMFAFIVFLFKIKFKIISYFYLKAKIKIKDLKQIKKNFDFFE